MSEAFLSKIEAAAQRVRAAFGETQEKLRLDYRETRDPCEGAGKPKRLWARSSSRSLFLNKHQARRTPDQP